MRSYLNETNWGLGGKAEAQRKEREKAPQEVSRAISVDEIFDIVEGYMNAGNEVRVDRNAYYGQPESKKTFLSGFATGAVREGEETLQVAVRNKLLELGVIGEIPKP